MKKQGLSVLIPTHNHVCVTLVKQLAQQLAVTGIDHEVIVADDGSTDSASIAGNQAINDLPHCRYLIRQENVGRAAIRNVLVREAQQPYVLFIDSDMTILNDNYIRRYLDNDCDTVIDGGVAIHGDEEALRGNLRYRYEKAEEPHHTAPERQKTPYQHLHTANLFVHRDLMLAHPFDERFRYYGYEDVLLGKTFRQQHIAIEHIDNPLGFCTFETNADFVTKTEEGLRTLGQFRDDLKGYSRLLTLVSNIHIPAVLTMIRLWHKLFGRLERRNLCGSHPSITIFKLYRLGYFICSCS
ncbi:MAG: glycosyltransferase family 2 protein [Prevotella sp.]|nr:glycosyltransferase family 2 protein [Prevotella sp.]